MIFTTSLIKLIQRHISPNEWREGEDYSVIDNSGYRHLEKKMALGYWPDGKSYIFRRYLAGVFRQFWCIHESYFERKIVKVRSK